MDTLDRAGRNGLRRLLWSARISCESIRASIRCPPTSWSFFWVVTAPDSMSSEIAEGLQIVEKQLKDRTVRTGEEELFKARARETGSVKLIDIVRAGSTRRTTATWRSCRASRFGMSGSTISWCATTSGC